MQLTIFFCLDNAYNLPFFYLNIILRLIFVQVLIYSFYNAELTFNIKHTNDYLWFAPTLLTSNVTSNHSYDVPTLVNAIYPDINE